MCIERLLLYSEHTGHVKAARGATKAGARAASEGNKTKDGPVTTIGSVFAEQAPRTRARGVLIVVNSHSDQDVSADNMPILALRKTGYAKSGPGSAWRAIGMARASITVRPLTDDEYAALTAGLCSCGAFVLHPLTNSAGRRQWKRSCVRLCSACEVWTGSGPRSGSPVPARRLGLTRCVCWYMI